MARTKQTPRKPTVPAPKRTVVKTQVKRIRKPKAKVVKDCDALFVKDTSRFVLFPIQKLSVWNSVKTLQQCAWVTEEIDFTKDQFHELTAPEQKCLKMVLAFFAGSDGIVIENLLKKFCLEIMNQEVLFFYTLQGYNEMVHSETYAKIVDSYVSDETEKAKLFSALESIPSVSRKGKWALKWINKKKPFAQRLIAFAIVEGVHFSSSFAFIFWFKHRGLMPGLTHSNEFISRDEGLHTDFACLIYKEYFSDQRVDYETIKEIFTEAVNIEKEFIRDAIDDDLGINTESMGQYVEFVADRLLTDLGYDKMYDSDNPFEFMENISIPVKTNFFESRVSQYRLHNVNTSMEDREISFDSPF